MSAADSGTSAVRARLIAAAALVSMSTLGDALARSPETCTPAEARQLAAIAELHGGTGLLAAARQLSSHRSQPQPEATGQRPASESAEPLSAAALEARIARYRVGPGELGPQHPLATATAAAPNPTHCQHEG